MDGIGKLSTLATDLHKYRALSPTAEKNASPAAEKAAREFEAVFLTQAVEEMLKSVKLGNLSGGHAEETWRSFLARAYADELANRGTTGIAQSVETTIAAYSASSRGGSSE